MNKSYTELINSFYSIDTYKKDDKNNLSILKKVKEKLTRIFISKNLQKEDEILNRYSAHIEELSALLYKQTKRIKAIKNDNSYENKIKITLKMQDELNELLLTQYILSHEEIEQDLGESLTHTYMIINFCNTIHNVKIKKRASDSDYTKYRKIIPMMEDFIYTYIEDNKQKNYEQQRLDEYISRLNIEKNSLDFWNAANNVSVFNCQSLLAKSIYHSRKQQKLTQKELSIRSGVGRPLISKIENMTQPTTLDTAIRLLTSLNMRITISKNNVIETACDTEEVGVNKTRVMNLVPVKLKKPINPKNKRRLQMKDINFIPSAKNSVNYNIERRISNV